MTKIKGNISFQTLGYQQVKMPCVIETDKNIGGEQGPLGKKGDKGDKGDPLTYNDLTEALKAEIAQPATAQAAIAVQQLEAIHTSIDNLDPSQSTSDAIVAEAATRASKDAELEAGLNALGPKIDNIAGGEVSVDGELEEGYINAGGRGSVRYVKKFDISEYSGNITVRTNSTNDYALLWVLSAVEINQGDNLSNTLAHSDSTAYAKKEDVINLDSYPTAKYVYVANHLDTDTSSVTATKSGLADQVNANAANIQSLSQSTNTRMGQIESDVDGVKSRMTTAENGIDAINSHFSSEQINGVLPSDGTYEVAAYDKLSKDSNGEYSLATFTITTEATKIYYRPSVVRRTNKQYSVAAAVFVGTDADKVVADGTWSATNPAWIYNVDLNTSNRNFIDKGVVNVAPNTYLAYQVEAIVESQNTLATTAYLRIPQGMTLNLGIKKIIVLDIDSWDKDSMLPILVESASRDSDIWANGVARTDSTLSDSIKSDIVEDAVEAAKEAIIGNDTIHIVVCGNSFSSNGFRYVGRVAKYLGKKVDVWMTGRSGASFERNIEAFDTNLIPQVLVHYDADTDTINEYGNNGNSDNTLGYTYKNVLALNKWNYIFVHQGSARSAADFDTHFGGSNDYMRQWIKRLRTNISNSNVKVGIQMTWPYHQDYPFTQQGMSDYGAPDADTMYANIISNIEKAKKLYDFDVVFPNGTAMKNAEFTDEYQSNDLIVHNTTDDVHISSIGMFACSLVVCCKLFNVDIDDIDVTQITTEVGSISNRTENKVFAKKIAKSALQWEWGATNVDGISLPILSPIPNVTYAV